MAAPRATTIQQRFGFHDNDLKTPKHDEIMLWLDEHIDTIVKNTVGFEIEIPSYCNPPAYIVKEAEDKYIFKVGKPIWEYPIMDKKYCIGFIDLVVAYETTCVWRENTRTYLHTEDNFVYHVGTTEHNLYFEIKSSIPSLGELVRQIRLYQQYAQGTFIVVCPDARFEKPLASQGIKFVEYK